MSILGQHKRWIEYEARVAEAREQHAKVSETANKEAARYREALAAHRAAVEEAVNSGSPIPLDEPQPSRSVAHALQVVTRRQEGLYAESKKLQAELTEDIERAARERWEARRGALAEAVAVLAEGVTVTRQDAREVAACRTLRDSQKTAIPRPTAGERTQTRWDIPGLVDVLQAGGDPFALQDVARPDGPFIEDGHGEPESSPPQRPMTRTRRRGFVSY